MPDSWSLSRRLPPILFVAIMAANCGGSPTSPTPVPGSPILVCPSDVTVTGVTAGSQRVVYPKPTLTGGSAPLDSSCSPAQGSTFPLGSTTVTCTTTDSLGRLATCSFKVTLSPLTFGVASILAFGDSVTLGEDGRLQNLRFSFVDPTTAYPTVLQSLINADFPGQGVTVVNAGKSGEPVSCSPPPAPGDTCGVMRLPAELARYRPDVLLLLHGYNDLAAGASAVDRVVAALRDSIRIARAAGVRFLFVSTLTPGRPATGPNNRQRDPEAILSTNAGIARLAPAEGAYLVDAFGAFLGREQELVNNDGLHLTVAGNRVLAETSYTRIREIIGRQGSSASRTLRSGAW